MFQNSPGAWPLTNPTAATAWALTFTESMPMMEANQVATGWLATASLRMVTRMALMSMVQLAWGVKVLLVQSQMPVSTSPGAKAMLTMAPGWFSEAAALAVVSARGQKGGS